MVTVMLPLPTLLLLLVHIILLVENLAASSGLPGTLHATWLSTAGEAAAVKLQVRPLLHGRGPLT